MVSAYRNRRLIGFSLMRVFAEHDVDFHDVAVHARYQRRGYGTALGEESIAWMRELECTEISALPTSHEARRLLERLDFQDGPLSGALVLQLR